MIQHKKLIIDYNHILVFSLYDILKPLPKDDLVKFALLCCEENGLEQKHIDLTNKWLKEKFPVTRNDQRWKTKFGKNFMLVNVIISSRKDSIYAACFCAMESQRVDEDYKYKSWC